MTDFATDYLLFVFLSALGVLLSVTAYGRLNGLLLLGRRLSVMVGGTLSVSSFVWFFTSEPRNLPDTGAGLDGNEQTLLFVAGAGSALLLILVLSSIRNRSMVGSREKQGLDALRNGNYMHLLLKEVRVRWGHLLRRMNEPSSG